MNDVSQRGENLPIDDEFNEDTQKDKYLTFHLADEDYGIEIKYVTEIIGILKITEVPDTPDFIRGVINLRGKVIPVMDVRYRFSMESLAYNERTCIIVVDINEISLGLVVDKVSDVVVIPENDIEPAPKVHKGHGNHLFIQGLGKMGDKVKIIIDVNKLLYREDVEKISDSMESINE